MEQIPFTDGFWVLLETQRRPAAYGRCDAPADQQAPLPSLGARRPLVVRLRALCLPREADVAAEELIPAQLWQRAVHHAVEQACGEATFPR